MNAFGAPIRTADIGSIRVIDAALSSIIQIGDVASEYLTSNALAVQREADHNAADEPYFESYPIFARPLPTLYPGYGNGVIVERNNMAPTIEVGCVRVIAISTSSVLQAGNTGNAVAESRIKHIRQFWQPPYQPDGSRTDVTPLDPPDRSASNAE